ncbi:MAG: DinB family protein [Alphaproteobacteria bacterium]
MISVGYYLAMAQYNRWMNQRLYECCENIDDVERKRDKGAFFGSIHRTLNHILYGDLAFMSRFTGQPRDVPELGIDLYEDFHDLWLARQSLDDRIEAWSSSLSEEWLQNMLTYASKVDCVVRTVPRWVLVTHMYNHETHHHGQVTTLLSQMGLDIGTTDIPFMPRFQD